MELAIVIAGFFIGTGLLYGGKNIGMGLISISKAIEHLIKK